jgi:hypothetical protein
VGSNTLTLGRCDVVVLAGNTDLASGLTGEQDCSFFSGCGFLAASA